MDNEQNSVDYEARVEERKKEVEESGGKWWLNTGIQRKVVRWYDMMQKKKGVPWASEVKEEGSVGKTPEVEKRGRKVEDRGM